MRHFLITCCFILLSCAVFGQRNDQRFQQIEAAKIAYITKQLHLSPTEAAKFFPIYNQYRDEMRDIYRAKRTPRSNFNRSTPPNELEFDTKVLACKKKYREKFSQVVSPAKASQFFVVEREFRDKLFKELQQRKR